jgi:hypothetical protein
MTAQSKLIPGTLDDAFTTYWDEMRLCRNTRAYWALLHITVCLPDISAALQSQNGETTAKLYKDWCNLYLNDPLLTGTERYQMRCKVLHQGRATIDQPGRYAGFSFGQPAPGGQVDHGRVDGKALNLDVGMLAKDTEAGVKRWIQQLETNPRSPEALNTRRNLKSLIRVRELSFPSYPVSGVGTAPYTTTLKTS